MDTWLIFHDIVLFLWRDGGLYLLRLIGLSLVLRGCGVGKSALLLKCESELSLKVCLRTYQRSEHASKKIFYVTQNDSVPQTDTGDQVE